MSRQNNLAVIKTTVTSNEASKDVAIALGINPNDEGAMNKAAKYAYGVYATIEASVGTKQDLSGCDAQSVKATMIEAANRGVYIDGRQNAYLVKYGNKCTFQMGWRGYLAKIKEFYPDADFIVEPVYQGDDVQIWNDNGQQKYTHKKAGAFRSGEKGFIGILFAVTYTDNGRLIQRVADVPAERIQRAKNAAKQDYIWKSDFIEKAKAAAIKNACKQLFASIQGLQDIVDYDNRENYDPNKGIEPASPARKTILDNINETVTSGAINEQPTQDVVNEPENDEVETQQFVEAEVVYADFEEVEQTAATNGALKGNLLQCGADAASKGVDAYKAWIATLEPEHKDLVRHMHQEWTVTARNADAAAQMEVDEEPPI